MKLFYYKAVYYKEGYPTYAFRDWTNGLTGYKAKLDPEIAQQLNIVFIGRCTEQEINDILEQRKGSYRNGYSKRISLGG